MIFQNVRFNNDGNVVDMFCFDLLLFIMIIIINFLNKTLS